MLNFVGRLTMLFQATCKTQPSWLVFLEEYGSEVEQAVTRRAEEWNANAQIKASPPL